MDNCAAVLPEEKIGSRSTLEIDWTEQPDETCQLGRADLVRDKLMGSE